MGRGEFGSGVGAQAVGEEPADTRMNLQRSIRITGGQQGAHLQRGQMLVERVIGAVTGDLRCHRLGFGVQARVPILLAQRMMDALGPRGHRRREMSGQAGTRVAAPEGKCEGRIRCIAAT